MSVRRLTSVRYAAVAAAAASIWSALPASAASIGINYVNSGDDGVRNAAVDSLLPTDVAGAPGYEQSNWNNFGRWGNPTAVSDSAGLATPVTSAWDATGTWATTGGTAIPGPTGHDKMMVG